MDTILEVMQYPPYRLRQTVETRERKQAIAAGLRAVKEFVSIHEPTRRSFGELPGDMPLDVKLFRQKAEDAASRGLGPAASSWTARADRLAKWEAAYDQLDRLYLRVGNWRAREDATEAELANELQAQLDDISHRFGLDGGALATLRRFVTGGGF